MSKNALIPKTQGIKYAGSKLKLIPNILNIVSSLNVRTILDGFSGSTRVSQAFAQFGYQTTSNDISLWSEVFSTAFLLNTKKREHYKDIIDHLNNLQGYDGWFTEHYGGQLNDDKKRPFQIKNTRKLDAIRDEIDSMCLDKIEKSVVLVSLILALDKVDSTLGHYVSYLSKWSPRSFNDLKLEVPNLFINEQQNFVKREDVFEVIKDSYFDFVYYDPPYGSNNDKMPSSRVRYNAYYHFWTTVILNDKPEVFGKVNRRIDTRDNVSSSIFEEFKKDSSGKFIAMVAIDSLIKSTNSQYILLSYSSGGRASKEELYDILSSNGIVMNIFEIDFKKNVQSSMRWTNEWINSDGKYLEYLFLIKKC
jgi:adenine-specific DNA-methyltransferase